jgi:hypothetical protein
MSRSYDAASTTVIHVQSSIAEHKNTLQGDNHAQAAADFSGFHSLARS